MIDTHMHLNDEQYDGITDEIVEGALKEGVNYLIVVGYDRKSSLKALSLANTYPFVYAAVGLHPSEVDREEDPELNWLKDLLNEDKVVAVGEIGLDFHYTKENAESQIAYFERQLKMAAEYNLPVTIHSRDALALTYDVLRKTKGRGVLHCYSGSSEMAKKFIDLGYSLGIGGVLTFKNTKLTGVVKDIPLEFLVTETDAPYLAPSPYRGKLNKPEYIPIIVAKIAKIKNISYSVVAKETLFNAKKIFWKVK